MSILEGYSKSEALRFEALTKAIEVDRERGADAVVEAARKFEQYLAGEIGNAFPKSSAADA